MLRHLAGWGLMEQQSGFCTTSDGVSVACATLGQSVGTQNGREEAE